MCGGDRTVSHGAPGPLGSCARRRAATGSGGEGRHERVPLSSMFPPRDSPGLRVSSYWGRTEFRLRLLQPEAHVHLAVERHGGRQVLLSFGVVASAAVEPAEAQVAVGATRGRIPSSFASVRAALCVHKNKTVAFVPRHPPLN